MKFSLVYARLLFIICMLVTIGAWSRGGGGCFEQGTLIDTVKGPRPIEQLRLGDNVWAQVRGKHQLAQVIAISEMQPQHYWQITLPNRKVHVTDEHLFALERGKFRRAASLKAGDKIIVWDGKQWQIEKIQSMAPYHAYKPAFNLLVNTGATFVANGMLVHNKGCFLPNTPILRADGDSIAINRIQPGDVVKAYEINGKLVKTKVHAVLMHKVNSYYIVTTDKAILNVTGEHPFFIGNGTFKTVEALHAGDSIYAFDGEKLTSQRIVRMDQVNTRVNVYNLQTDEPHTYFAAGIAVHNKGGGGGGFGGHGGGSHSGDDSGFIYALVLYGIFYLLFAFFGKSTKSDEDLDFVYSRNQILPKANKTMKLLNFIAKQDDTMVPNKLKDLTRTVFLKLQQCWEKRDYAPMQAWLMPDLYKQHCRQIQGMIQNHEINKISSLSINMVDLVNVRYTDKSNQREFTALITATATDYYINDTNNEFIRGDREPAQFQEFWTFQLQSTGWLLRDIEQSRESDYLKEENFFEQYTDRQIEQIYGDAVDNLGETGPWLPKDVAIKETKVERMLNFLAESNKMWDRQTILNRVRTVFTNVHLALEAGELNPEVKDQLFPAVAEQFTTTINAWKANGNTIEYRNFCVRKIEILLVKSFDDKSQNEFTARVSAHAQRVHLQNDTIITEDTDVTPFIEYWTFGCLNDQWKLKEARPEAAASGVIDAENIEEGSSPNLVKWYYTKKRAL